MNKHLHLVQFILTLTLLVVTAVAIGAKPAPGDTRYSREDQSEADVFPPSIFPHWIHRIRYRCDACHDSLFEMKPGGTPVTMDLMKEGKVCGACHNDEQAFAANLQNCNRCHTSPAE